MSSNSLNDLSKVYLDRVATLNTDLNDKDVKRWEDLGGPTPGNYNSIDDSAKLKQEGKDVAATSQKQVEKATRSSHFRRFGNTTPPKMKNPLPEGLSDWRSEGLFEVITTPTTDKKDLKKISEKPGINNKVEINPKLREAVAEMGGELLEVTDAPAKDPGKEDQIANQLRSKESRQKMIKKQVLLKKLQAVRAGSHHDIVASYEPEIEGAVEFFYEEGINEEGLDLIIEEIGLDDFVNFVIEDSEFLTEEEGRPARRATVRAKKYDVVKKEVDKADAARRASKKGEYAPSYAKKETDVTVYDDKPSAKKKAPVKKAAPKPVAKKVKPKPVVKKVVKAVAKAKPAQPVTKPSKVGLRNKIRDAVKAGVKRHKKAVQPARVFAKGFKRGVTDTVKFAKKAKKAVVGEATDAQLKSQEKAVFELEKREANKNRAKAKKAREKEISEKLDYDPMDDPDFDPREAEKKRGVSGKNNPKGGKKLKDLTKEEVGISSAAAMEKARKEAALRKKEEEAVKKAKKVNEEKKVLPKLKMYRKAGNLARKGDPESMKKQTKIVSVLNKETSKGYKKAALDKLRDGSSPKHQTEDYEALRARGINPIKGDSPSNGSTATATRSGTRTPRPHRVVYQTPRKDARDAARRKSNEAQTGKDATTGETLSPEERKRRHREKVANLRASGASMRGEGFSNWREDLLEDAALDKVKKDIIDQHGKGAIYDPKNPPKAQPKPKAKPDTRTPEQKKADQHKANMDAVYGGPQRDRGLGT